MFCRAVILILCSVLKLINCDLYRLPKNVQPIRYILTVEPFLDQDSYHGSVIIEIKILENTNNITFHENGLDIAYDDIKIVSSSGVEAQLRDTSENNKSETFTILLETELLKNIHYNLTIGNFSRKFSRRNGFFLERAHGDFKKSNITIAVTHFEPIGARWAFPCFDEPALKAKFVISLIRKEGYHSVSNEALEKIENLGDGRFKDTFKETPIMPTYSVAFAVSNFKFTRTIEKQRVFGMPRTIEDGNLDTALEVGVRVLQELEDFTGINYTLSKIDQLAVPEFTMPGMENWGLIMYRESFVTINNESNAEKLQLATLIVSHEFGHQWFGNLVTPEWWDYLWLSESFATYFQYYIGSTMQPSWRLMDQIVIEMVQRSLFEEEFTIVGALNDPIKRSGGLPSLHIMYLKGTAIIRMTEHFLTHNVFKNGVRIYLQNNQFSSTTPSDLYSALQTAVDNAGANNLLGNMSVEDILTTWDSTKSFPIVNVRRNYTSGSLTLTQHRRRFIHGCVGHLLGCGSNSSLKKSRNFSGNVQPRIIPINYVFSIGNGTDFSKTKADYWLKEGSATIDGNFSTDGWVIVNIQQTGYYRVNYDLENWERLVKFMNSDNFTSIHVLNRAQLVDDAFNLAYSELIPWRIPFSLSQYLTRETDYIPIAAFCNRIHDLVYSLYKQSFEEDYEYFQNLTLVNTISGNATSKEFYKAYVNTALSGIQEYLGPEPKPGDTHLDKLSRIKVRLCTK